MEITEFKPKQKYIRFKSSMIFFLVLLSSISIVFVIAADFNQIWIKIIAILTLITLIILSLALIFYFDKANIATLWDDYDYSELIKEQIEFIAPSTNRRHFAYRYHKKTDLLNNDSELKPALIGLHGWGSHHREMDRYCLPAMLEEGYLYFTYDAQGQGLTPGDKNSWEQMDEAKDFIDFVYNQPNVNKKRIAVCGMSMGAAKMAVAAYPNPKVKVVLGFSGPYDFTSTTKNMDLFEKIGFALSGFKFKGNNEDFKNNSGINYFNPDGITLEGDSHPTPNPERVFLSANLDDPVVRPSNTLQAIEKLNLPKENYRLYRTGKHIHISNEWSLSVAIYKFLKEKL